MNTMTLEDRFHKAIRTSQKPGGGIYVEAQLAINDEIYTYGQFYRLNVPEAVEAFKKFYFPLFVTDVEDNSNDQ